MAQAQRDLVERGQLFEALLQGYGKMISKYLHSIVQIMDGGLKSKSNSYKFALLRYEEAEQRLKIMKYLPIWPGTDDSDHPINCRQIATAQMAQQHWEAAEDSPNKSVSFFDPQIQKALKSDNEFSRTEHARNLIGSKAKKSGLPRNRVSA